MEINMCSLGTKESSKSLGLGYRTPIVEYVTYVEDNKHNVFFDPLIWELIPYMMSNCIKQYLGLESNGARNEGNKNMEEMTK
jgi:hypothetical protein